MPLLSPTAIKNVLKESGIKKDLELKDLLGANSLGPEELIEELGHVVRGADSSAIKLRGIETGLKLNGLLTNNDAPQMPTVNIIINDPQYTDVNPILLPRSK